MKNTILPIVLLGLFTASIFAQGTCDLPIETAPVVGKFRLGMTLSEARAAFPKMTVQNVEKDFSTTVLL